MRVKSLENSWKLHTFIRKKEDILVFFRENRSRSLHLQSGFGGKLQYMPVPNCFPAKSSRMPHWYAISCSPLRPYPWLASYQINLVPASPCELGKHFWLWPASYSCNGSFAGKYVERSANCFKHKKMSVGYITWDSFKINLQMFEVVLRKVALACGRTCIKRGKRREQPRDSCSFPTAALWTGDSVISAPRISQTSTASNHTSGLSPVL